MCGVTYFQHKKCKHMWAVITEPCGPGLGFSTCARMGDGSAREAPRLFRTRGRPCPRCGLRGAYDLNAVRMVSGMGWGVKWGTGPGKEDWGCEIELGRMKPGCVVL